MGQGYQDRDFEIVDYELYRLPDIPRPLRGPKPECLDDQRYFACVGAAQTFGCFSEQPFPALLGRALGMPALNLGAAGVGPAFPLLRPGILERCNRARFVVVQVMSGRSESNSRFDQVNAGELLVRRKDGVRLGARPAWKSLVRRLGRRRLEALIEENRVRWVDHFQKLLRAIEAPVILFWFSERGPDYRRSYWNVDKLMGPFPQFVDRSWIDPLLPLASEYVECVTSRGLPQPLVSRFTGEPVKIEARPDLKEPLKDHNSYYPSPEMHEDACRALLPACRRLLSASGS